MVVGFPAEWGEWAVRCKTAVRYFVFCLLLCGFTVGCSSNADVAKNTDSPIPVKLALNWYPEAEHGGYIAANVHGYFNEEKLNVDVIPGDTGAPQTVIAELGAGRVMFAISDADNLIKARSKGMPLVAVLAPLQMTPRCIMVHEASGILKLEDLADVELAISEARPFALWMKKKLPLTNVTMVPYSGGVGEFLARPKFAQQAFVFSEPFVAREQGGDPRALMVSDIGFNPYACLLVTTESVIAENESLVRSVVRACSRGWEKYLKDPAETNAVISRDNSAMSAAVLQYGVEQLEDLCRPEDGLSVGGMTLERWQVLVQQIEEIGEISAGSVQASDCFTTRFLPESSAGGAASTEESKAGVLP